MAYQPWHLLGRFPLAILLFAIAMILLSYILWKSTGGNKSTKSKDKINDFMYMGDIKLFAKSKTELDTLIQTIRIYCQNIGMEFDIEKCAMLIMLLNRRSKTAKLKKNQNGWREGKLEVLRSIGSRPHQRIKRKNK